MNMDRRSFLKLASLTGAGLVTASLPFRTKAEAAPQYFMITDNPEQDVIRLFQSAGLSSADNMHVATTLAQPAGQDLSIIWDGRMVDPLKNNSIPLSVRSFTGTLRRRNNDGLFLVTVEPTDRHKRNVATFEYDGKIVEQVSLENNYTSIVIPGKFGETQFQIRDGNVSVMQSSCRHHLCENMGSVHNGRIVCAPNKLVANVRGGINQVDSITG